MDDLYDITRSVRPIRVRLTGVAEPLDAYTNGKSFFLTAAQVESVAAALGDDRIQSSPTGGWQETVPGKGTRVLAERHIEGSTFYRFRKYWEFTPVENSTN